MYSFIAVIHFNLLFMDHLFYFLFFIFLMAVAKFLCHLDLHPQKCQMFL